MIAVRALCLPSAATCKLLLSLHGRRCCTTGAAHSDAHPEGLRYHSTAIDEQGHEARYRVRWGWGPSDERHRTAADDVAGNARDSRRKTAVYARVNRASN